MSARPLPLKEMVRIRFVRSAFEFRLYVNDELSSSATVSSTFNDRPGWVTPDRLTIGAHTRRDGRVSGITPFPGIIKNAKIAYHLI